MKNFTALQNGTTQPSPNEMSANKLDPKARQALAKVYALLYRLALENEARKQKAINHGDLDGSTQPAGDQQNSTLCEG